jgi:hypothetical protein
MNQEVTKYIEKAIEPHQGLLLELRKRIMSIVPDATEQFKWSRPVYGLEKDFCYLQTTKKHVTLGFFEFDKIKTNKNLIEGTGKSMRHIKLSSIDDIHAFQIEKMLEEVLN